MYELSVQEILDLTTYITKRIEKLVNGKYIRRFKNYRISTIVNILNKKKAIDNSKLMKLSKKLQVSKFVTVGKTVLNYANPIFWFRKLAIKPSTTLVTKEVCKLIIRIFGEETDKIYGKKLYERPDDNEKVEAEFDQVLEDSLPDEVKNS
jgi:RAB protein geranylgeranyltransferase component A